MGKKVIDAKADAKGNITAVKLSGNSGFTSLEAAMRMADKGQIDNAHSVHRKERSLTCEPTPIAKPAII